MESIASFQSYVQIITITMALALTGLIAWAIHSRTKYSTDTNAKPRFRKIVTASVFVTIAILVTYNAPNFTSQMIIEPAGGVDLHSDGIVEKRLITETPREARDRIDQQSSNQQKPSSNNPATAQNIVPEQQGWSAGGPLRSALRSQRVIVHTAATSLTVPDIPRAIDLITAISQKYNGWLVSSSQRSQGTGAAAIRVPAKDLQQAIADITSTADSVESLDLQSEDVTEEYIDLQSEIEVLLTAEKNYLAQLANAPDLPHHLKLTELITRTQQNLRKLQGRLEYLSTVSSFSLINISLKLTPLTIRVDAGPDRTVRAGTPFLIDAIIDPPPGLTSFQHSWDFGDDTGIHTRTSTALISEGQETRTTNPLTHLYPEPGRHIVQVEVEAAGPDHRATGKDTIILTVKAIPSIKVSLPLTHLRVSDADEFTIRGGFTQPPELHSYQYAWDFGDGTPTILNSVPQGTNQVEVTHRYTTGADTHIATLTVTATSEAGQVSAEETMTITVTPRETVIRGNWDVGNWVTLGLSGVFALLSVLSMLTVWLLIFSPFALVIGGGTFLIKRYLRIRREDQYGPMAQ